VGGEAAVVVAGEAAVAVDKCITLGGP
jgi:hypothetical protein